MSLEEGFRKAFMAGVGIAAYTAENAGKVIDNLAKKGEEVSKNSKVMNDGREYAKKVHEDIKNSQAKKRFDDVCEAVDNMTKEDREKLKEKLAEADKAAKQTFEGAVEASKEKFEEWKKEDESDD